MGERGAVRVPGRQRTVSRDQASTVGCTQPRGRGLLREPAVPHSEGWLAHAFIQASGLCHGFQKEETKWNPLFNGNILK